MRCDLATGQHPSLVPLLVERAELPGRSEGIEQLKAGAGSAGRREGNLLACFDLEPSGRTVPKFARCKQIGARLNAIPEIKSVEKPDARPAGPVIDWNEAVDANGAVPTAVRLALHHLKLDLRAYRLGQNDAVRRLALLNQQAQAKPVAEGLLEMEALPVSC